LQERAAPGRSPRRRPPSAHMRSEERVSLP
jgi:hypothetical protein